MKMKKYIVAGIMVAALMTSGCGKFVRDELITMQNEIDILYRQVKDMNEKLVDLQALVQQMASNGYIVDVNEYQDEVHG